MESIIKALNAAGDAMLEPRSNSDGGLCHALTGADGVLMIREKAIIHRCDDMGGTYKVTYEPHPK